MTVLETVTKVAARDEASAATLLQFALYEALCTEADVVADSLERDVRAYVAKRAAQALPELARAQVSKGQSEGRDRAAEYLSQLVLVGKSQDDPKTPWYDARDEHGRFVASGVLARTLRTADRLSKPKPGGKVSDTLGAFTGAGQTGLQMAGDDRYGRAKTLGSALMTSGQPGVQAAGVAARLVGDLGQEAENVLGPGIRRTAYRYRGTERRPDAKAQRNARILTAVAEGRIDSLPPDAQAEAMRWGAMVHGTSTQDTAALMRNTAGKGPQASRVGRLNPAAGATVGLPDKASDDQRRLIALSNYGVNLLVDKVPNLERANISLQAGKLPPSIGVMFDSQGRLVSEAQGFNGDHYLPFDLKNLKRLHGGQYVRTRTSGGLTDEDIYTALMTGARKVTVVSNSGVFSMEFDPDLRGGRRYSDKARQMVDRYARLVGAIGSNELRQNDISREEKVRLRTEAIRDSGGNADIAERQYKQRLTAARSLAAFSARSDEDLMSQAETEVGPQRLSSQQHAIAVRERFHELRNADAQQAVRTYKLDHDGYKAAQDALAQEFPFFIRDKNTSELQDYLEVHRQVEPGVTPRRPRGGKDIGYTQRRGLSPQAAGSLGAPAGKTRREAAAPTAAPSTAAAAEGAAAPAVSTSSTPANLEQASKAALSSMRMPLAEALSATLGARQVPVDNPNLWGPMMEEQDYAASPVSALSYGPGNYAEWLFRAHGSDYGKAAQWLLTEADAEQLDRTVASLKTVKAKVATLNAPEGMFPPEQYDEAIEIVERARLLKQPFAKSPDDTHAPQPDPEITPLATDPEALAAFEQANPDLKAAADAIETHDEDQIVKLIGEQRRRLSALGSWEPGAPPPSGVSQSDRGKADAIRQAMSEGLEHDDITNLTKIERAWSLSRARKVAAALRGGGAVPFEPAAKRHSRVTRYDEQSPVAKALARRLRDRH